MYPSCKIVLVVSGLITQRGDLSIIDSFDKAKIMNHDDIPIVVNNINFVDLLEKELANEKFYNLKYNNKSFNLSQIKNSSNLMEKSLDNQQNILNQKENYDRDDYDSKGKIVCIIHFTCCYL